MALGDSVDADGAAGSTIGPGVPSLPISPKPGLGDAAVGNSGNGRNSGLLEAVAINRRSAKRPVHPIEDLVGCDSRWSFLGVRGWY